MESSANCCRQLLQTLPLLGALVCVPVRAQEPGLSFERRDESVVLKIAGQPVATYVLRDAQVSHPYFAHIRTPSGIQISRTHPPQEGVDATDHAGLHAGIWMSFGTLSGQDYWRMKARTDHVRFLVEPRVVAGVGGFAVLNRYGASAGGPAIAEEDCRISVVRLPGGYRLDWRSQFTPLGAELVFGDQEEMGLGIRMATSLAVDRKQGGRLLDDQGRRDEGQIWGRTVDWIDYAGPLQGAWVGMTVMAGPDNFRRCWAHVRDYGFAALNPFGRKAFTGQDESRVVVRRGETLTLTYGIVVHESKTESDVDVAALYRDFITRVIPNN
ncbi:MAG: DUF6807 family protein [Pirellulaceae bacterium]